MVPSIVTETILFLNDYTKKQARMTESFNCSLVFLDYHPFIIQ